MHYIIRVLVVIAAGIIALILMLVWLWLQPPAYIINWWNQRIKSQCDIQDSESMNGIPSYIDAWNSKNTHVVSLHQLITLNHEAILAEVESLLQHHSGDVLDINLDQDTWCKTKSRWRPIWIKFMGDLTSAASSLPTLYAILQEAKHVPNLYISIFYPGMTVVESKSNDRSLLHYQYGLKIPYADIGLKINGFDAKWIERAGQVWDNTLPHSAWNHTDQPRIVIFADVYRQLNALDNVGTTLIHHLLKSTSEANNFKTLLQHSSFHFKE